MKAIIIILLLTSCSAVEYIDSTPDIEVFPQKQVTYALTADGWAVDTIPK